MKYLQFITLLLAFAALNSKSLAQDYKLKLTVDNETELTATLVDNSSVDALVELLQDGPLTIAMSDYGNMEKVGPIGSTLPRNDQQITTEAGDIILYQGSALVIYYAPNSWNFTRLGKIDNVSASELKTILGEGSVSVTLELQTSSTAVYDVVANNVFQVYPNPANNYVRVNGPATKLTLFSALGQRMVSTQSLEMDLSGVASGVYFLQIESDMHPAFVQKIIKQ